MNTDKVEQLLEERARLQRDDSLLSSQSAEQVRNTLAAEAAREAQNVKRWRFKLVVGGLAAAAALVLLLRVMDPEIPTGRPSDVEVAVLDSMGRELESKMRSGSLPGAPFERPTEFLLELVSSEGAHVSIHLFDPQGFRQAGGNVQLPSEGEDTRAYPLGDYETNSSGESVVSVVVISAQAAIASAKLNSTLPTRLQFDRGEARRSELERIAAELAEQLGCSVTVRHIILDRRGE